MRKRKLNAIERRVLEAAVDETTLDKSEDVDAVWKACVRLVQLGALTRIRDESGRAYWKVVATLRGRTWLMELRASSRSAG